MQDFQLKQHHHNEFIAARYQVPPKRTLMISSVLKRAGRKNTRPSKISQFYQSDRYEDYMIPHYLLNKVLILNY